MFCALNVPKNVAGDVPEAMQRPTSRNHSNDED